MGRIITDERKALIRAAREADPEALGPHLAEMVIEGHVPVETVARMLAVAEPTIYRWMYGEAHPRDADKIEKIKRLLTLLQRVKDAGGFPLEGTTAERTATLCTLLTQAKSRKA